MNAPSAEAAFIDSHTHLDSADFDTDRDQVIARARAAGVRRFVTIGAGDGFGSAERALDLCARHDFIWAAVGIHPNDASEAYDMDRLAKLASRDRVVAIGETGLDFFRDHASPDDQRRWFRGQIELACALKKPLVIHSRAAAEECLTILRECGAVAVGGVFHCFSEDAEFARRLEDINFIVSFPGSLTFKKAEQMLATAAAIPLDRIMLETDAPYLAPEPHRGHRCESAFLVETARVLAKAKNVSLEEIARATTANAERLFGLPSEGA